MSILRFAGLASLVGGLTAFIATDSTATPTENAVTCLTSEGKTACGYNCLASYGEVRCAQRPEGICVAGSGTVTCWDPPPIVRLTFPFRAPRPHCRAGRTLQAQGCGAVFRHLQLRRGLHRVQRVPVGH